MTSELTPEQIAALDHARHLAESGVPVFCAYPDPDGKTPSGRQTGFRLPDAWESTTPNPAYVDAWKPGMALCAVMGHVIDLVDVDPRNGGTLTMVAEVVPHALGTAATPSDGIHLFVPSMHVKSAKAPVIGPGIDIKSGGGEYAHGHGFAFLAPTERFSKTTGELNTYRWLSPPHLNGNIDAADLSVFAAKLGTDKPSRADGDADDWHVPDVIEPGTRNQTLFDLACLWRGHGLSMRIARMEMEDAWRRCEQIDSDPFVLADAHAILERVYDTYKINAWPGIVPVSSVLRTDAPATDETPDERPFDGFYLDVTQLHTLPTPEPIIDGMLDGRTLFGIVGRDRTYKSFLALDWLACVATGKAWMGKEVERGKVLYVVGEGAYGLHGRFDAWQAAWARSIEPGWFTVRRAPVNLFRAGSAVDELIERVAGGGFSVVVFDTLARNASGGNLNLPDDASLVINAMDKVRVALDGGSVGYVAHSGKSDMDIRGASNLEDDLDQVWHMKRDDDSTDVELVTRKRKDGPEDEPIRLRPKLVVGTDSLVLEQPGAFASAAEPKRSGEALIALGVAMRINEPHSMSSLATALKLNGKGSVSKMVHWLEGAGLVAQNSSGRYPFWYLTAAGMERYEALTEGQK